MVRVTLSRHTAILAAFLVSVFVAAAMPTAIRAAAAADLKPERSAEQLVHDALRAEIDGNSAKRRVLLSVAVDAQPEFAPAHWHSGHVQSDGEWLPLGEAQVAAAANPARVEYVVLREAATGSPQRQLALARWCRKNGLEDEARFHWTTVLTFDPDHDEALRALGVRWFRGRLMTAPEIANINREMRAQKEAVRNYATRVANWTRLLTAGDIKSRDTALQEIGELRDEHAIPALEAETLPETLSTNEEFELCQKYSQALLAALDAMPQQAATNSLLRHATFSPLTSIRDQAAAALKKRSPHHYVPQLLNALAMPVESSFRVVTDADGSVHYFHSLYREGQRGDWSFEGRLSAMQHDLQGPTLVKIDDRVRDEVVKQRFGAANNPAVRMEMASVARQNARGFSGQATAREQRVAAINLVTESANQVILPVLVATTGQNLGDNPRVWWDWWNEYNEYSTDGESPVREQRYAESSHRYYRLPDNHSYRIDPPPDPSPRRYSCFAKGTPVWTNIGERPIEELQIGDFVLAQDVDTGELAYKPVIGRTVRPPSPTIDLVVEGETLRTTLGHPFWLAGKGWQMAKELSNGAILHGVHGPVQIASAEPADEAEAYNLVVADFNTYFVGKTGVLVHDNTMRSPTTALVPGLIAAAAAP